MPLHPLLEKMLAQPGRPQFSDGSPADARAIAASARVALGAGPEVGSVDDVQIPTQDGHVAARLYKPAVPPQGVVVYLHGGGWVVGTLDDFDALARSLAVRSGCAVLLVDYRLAPEHAFPAGFNDAVDSLRWSTRLCQQLSPTATGLPLIVAGDSAGANLAIAAALALRGEVSLAFQALVYPVTDCDFDTASYQAYGQKLLLTGRDMQWFFNQYAPAALWQDARISPLRAPSLSGSPATWMATAEYDVLRDEGEAFAARLEAEGIAVELRRYAGLTHGFVRMMNVLDTASAALDDMAAAIARVCHSAVR